MASIQLTVEKLAGHDAHSFELPADTLRLLTERSGEHSVKLESVICGAWAALLSRFYNSEQVALHVVGSENGKGAHTIVSQSDVTLAGIVSIHDSLSSCADPVSVNCSAALEDSGVATYCWCGAGICPDLPKDQDVSGLHGRFQYAGADGVTSPIFTIYYEQNHFQQTTIERLAVYFLQLLQEAARHPQKTIGELEMLTEQDKRQLIHDLNRTQVEYPKTFTVQALFEQQVLQAPDRVAVVEDERELTYRELNKKANQLARRLRKQGVTREQTVGIMAERTAEMVIGILAILKAGGTYVPLDPDHPQDRIQYVLEDSDTRLVLTSRLAADYLPGAIERVIIDDPDLATELEDNLSPVNQPEDLIYIIYTSGSTGRPKGVMVTHRNVIRLVKHTNYVKFGQDDRILQTGSLVFDASTFEIWGSLLNGLGLVLVDKTTILDAEQLEQAIVRHGVTIMFLTTALFIQLVDRNPRIFAPLRQLLVGGELMSPKHFYRAAKECAPIAISNIYGPTENTTFSTSFELKHEVDGTIPIGTPITNSTAYVVNEYGKLQPIGGVGELWVGGEGVARGYLNQEELTQEKFIDSPFVQGERIYKTGDLVRMLPNGSIEFVGRKDHQVKIRGYRMELGEIEAQIHAHEQVTESIVIDFEETPGQKALCAYIVAEGGMTAAEIREYLSQHLPEYMVPAYFMFLDRMPLTINGKIDRAKLPQPEKRERAVGGYTAPVSETEIKLAYMWEELLGIAPIGTKDHFFELGGHSLKMAQLQAKIAAAFRVTLSFKELFANPFIGKLAALIDEGESGRFEAIEPAEAKPHYRLAPAQTRMFALQQRGGVGMAYHIPLVYQVKGKLDAGRLEQALNRLVERHEAFRTSFHWEQDEVIQKVCAHTGFRMPLIAAEGRTAAELADEFVQPFQLDEAPLFRAALAKLGEDDYVLLLDIHHIVFDGTSLSIFAEELSALYEGKDLTPVRLQYKDYAEWQSQRKQDIAAHEGHWLRVLEGELPVLELPADSPRPNVQSFEGDIVRVTLPAEAAAGLKQMALDQGTTLYMTLLSIYNVLLSKYADKEDVIVGCAIAARTHADLNRMMGMFVNTLPIRSYPEGEKTFAAYLEEMKDTLLSAYEHQDYPLDSLIDRLQLKRDVSRNPLFDTVFVMQNMGDTSLQMGDAAFVSVPYHNGTSKFDLTLEAVENEESLSLNFEFCSKLFTQATVERMAEHFVQLAAQAAEQPESKIGELEMITRQEQQQLIHEFNQTEADYPRNSTVHALFEEQARITPGRIALVAGERELTYGELNAEANRLAWYLRQQGTKPEQPVGLFTERTAEMVIGVLAIMKAGGAYVPIDPDYPQERIQYLLEDSGAAIVLTSGHLAERLPEGLQRIGFSDPELSHESTDNLEHVNDADHLIYLMYTSGSTGKPKGVMVTHRNVIRLVKNTNFVTFQEDDCILQTGSLVFDASTFEIWGALLNGLRLVLVDKTTILDAEQLERAIAQHGITMMWLTSPLFTQLVEKNEHLFAPVRTLLVGGDVLSPKHIYRVLHACAPIAIVNGYGPTENTTFSCCHQITAERDGSIPIGMPIANSTAYVVNGYGKLQPIGVAGELWVGGDGVARGYLNRDDLTQENFIDSPFIFGEKLYKTGDLVRWLPDGTIEFLGRKDHQVKIRGYRMELGEIEAQIRSHELVKETLVTDIEESAGQKALCAYIVAEGTLTAADIRQHLLSHLPDYMIPTYYAFLEQMPLTTNGKIDRSKLPAPSKQEWTATNYVPPANETEMKLADMWQELLGIASVGVCDNFFELGGHSLKAITLVAQLKQEFEVDVSDIFAYPTIRELAQHMKYRPNHMKDKLEQIREAYLHAVSVEEDKVVSEGWIQYRSRNERYGRMDLSERARYRNVLLTGATGYLGAYLLRDLLVCTDSKVTAVVRGESSEQSRQRLNDKLAYYFGPSLAQQHGHRIVAINGNLSEERLGLEEDVYSKLSDEVDCIIHAAANVKHYGHYSEFVLNNVTATERLLELAAAGNKKEFHHVSTMSVGMGTIEGESEMLFTEDDRDIGQRHDNYYVQTKFAAEKQVEQARENGVNANIYRIGNIVFNSENGQFQENIHDNGFYNTVKAFIGLGAVPEAGQDTDLSYVDQVSRAIITLFDKPALHNETFHIYNPNRIGMSDMLAKRSEFSVMPLPMDRFLDYLFERYEQKADREAVENVMLHSGWMDEGTAQTSFVHAAERTTAVLGYLGFTWTAPGDTQITSMLNHCREVGFLSYPDK